MPGAEEVALFDRMGGLIRGEDSRFDLMVFDTAPTGHTLRLIRMPELMEAWIRALSRSRQAMLGIDQDDKTDPVMMSLTDRLEGLREFRARLLSPRISAFMLVLVAERLPIEETARAIEQLNEAGVRVGGLVVNRVLPATSPDPFLQSRHAQEVVYLDEIDRRFAKHTRVRVPQLASDVHGVKTLEVLSSLIADLADRADPCRGRPERIPMSQPAETEFAPFYAGYIAKVGDRGPLAASTPRSPCSGARRLAEPRPTPLRRGQVERQGGAGPSR